MAHKEQRNFCLYVRNKFLNNFKNKKVLDFGSLDINGSNKDLFTDCDYKGIDLGAGKNVDIISKGHEYYEEDESIDTIISTEMFEHDKYYPDTLRNIIRLLKPGGLFLFTCATTGRPIHGTKNTTNWNKHTNVWDSPFTGEIEGWDNYYKNITEEDIREILDVDNIFEHYRFQVQGLDLYFWGVKKLDYSLNVKNIDNNLKTMEPITYCIPSKNNLRYLKPCIKYIRENEYNSNNKIIIFVDQDNDGTIQWLDKYKDKYNLTYYVNPSNTELYGIAKAYDYCIDKSETDIIMVYHADMILGKHADLELYRYLKTKPNKIIVCSTRIEPPLHIEGWEKIVEDFGLWPETGIDRGFESISFNEYVRKMKYIYRYKTTNGMFAPWMIRKSDFYSISGHDYRFKSAREDSDLFNRLKLAGFEFIQVWASLVYHLTCRAGQFQHVENVTDFYNKSPEWSSMMNNSTKEYIRKWGEIVQTDKYLHPIIHPKKPLSIVILDECPGINLLDMVEIFGDHIYLKNSSICNQYKQEYIYREQINTIVDLDSKIILYDNLNYNEFKENITLSFNSIYLNDKNYQFIVHIQEILQENIEILMSNKNKEFSFDIFNIWVK